MKILKTQLGSMILEQLAILALAGVMTVGGVYIYSEVSARFQADSIKSEALLRATSILSSSRFSKADVGDTILASEFKRPATPVSFTQKKHSEALIVVSASQMRKKVCEKLRDAPMDKDLLSIYINCPNQEVSNCRSVAQGGGTCQDNHNNTVSFLIGKLKGRTIGDQPNDQCPDEDRPLCYTVESYTYTPEGGEPITCYHYEEKCVAPSVCRPNNTCGCDEGYRWDAEQGCVESGCSAPTPYHNGSGCVQCLEDADCPSGSGQVCQSNGFCAPGCAMDFSEPCASCSNPQTPYFNGGSCVCHEDSCGVGYVCSGGRCVEKCDSKCEAYLNSHTDSCCQGYFCDTGTSTSMIGKSSEAGTCNPVRYNISGHWACSKTGNMNWYDAQAFCNKLDAQVPNAGLVHDNLEAARTACGDLASVWLSETGISDKLGWYADLGGDATARVQTLSASSAAMHALCYREAEDPYAECLEGAPCEDGRTCINGLCNCAVNAYWDGNGCVECPVGWNPIYTNGHYTCGCADNTKCCGVGEKVVVDVGSGDTSCEPCALGFEPDSAKTACQACNANFTQTCATCTDPEKPYWDGSQCVKSVNCTGDDECTGNEVCVTASGKCSSCLSGTWRNSDCGGSPCTSGQHCALTGLNKWGWMTGLYCSGEGAGSGGGRSVDVVIGSKQYTYTYYNKGRHSWFESYNICEAIGGSIPSASEISQNYQAIAQALGTVAYVWSGDAFFNESDQICKAQIVSLNTGDTSTAGATGSYLTICRMAKAHEECKYSGEYCRTSGDCCTGSVCMSQLCEPCPANTYRSDNQCLMCVEGSTALEGSDECTCAAGSVWDKGTNTCAQCEANTYQSGQECLPCENGSTAVAGSTKCACADGYYWDEEENACYQCTNENAADKCTGVRCTTQEHCGGVGSNMFCDNASKSSNRVRYGYCAATGTLAVPSYSSSRDQTAVNNGIGPALLGSKAAADAILGGHFVVSADKMKMGSGTAWCEAFGLTLATKAQLGNPTYGWDVYAVNCEQDEQGNNIGCPIVHALGSLYSYTHVINHHPNSSWHSWMILYANGRIRYDFSETTGYSTHALCYRESGDSAGAGCLTHADCGSGLFCKYPTPSDNCSEIPDVSGTCSPIGSREEHKIPGWGTLYRSKNTMNYWSAKDWCAAQGDSLADLEGNPMQCYRSGYGYSSGTWSGYCCRSSASCTTAADTQSPIMQEMRRAFSSAGSTAFWSARKLSATSCQQWMPRMSDGYMCTTYVRTNNYYALCMKERDSTCQTHNDCASGQYCRYETPAEACSRTTPSVGHCRDIEEKLVRTVTELGRVTRGWVAMNYWSAKDWCEAQGLRLLTGTELQCRGYNTNDLLDLSNQATGYCRKPKTTYGTLDHLSVPARGLLTSETGFGGLGSDQYVMWTSTQYDLCNNYGLNGSGQMVAKELSSPQYPTCVAP